MQWVCGKNTMSSFLALNLVNSWARLLWSRMPLTLSEQMRKFVSAITLMEFREVWTRLLMETRRPASADGTARRQFQTTGQPVSRTQASDAMTSRLPRYEAKYVCNAGASNAGRSLSVQISRERSYSLPVIPLERQLTTLQLCR